MDDPHFDIYADEPFEARPTRFITIARAIAVSVGAGLFVGVMMVAAWPHDAPTGWTYDMSCCSSIDCRHVERVAVIEGPDGYVIRATGETITYSSKKIRPSKDGDFRWCSVAGRDDGKTICLYVPHGGS